jgi:hypothetical protein
MARQGRGYSRAMPGEAKTRIALLGVLGVLITAVAGTVVRRRRRAPEGPPASHPVPESSAQLQDYTCRCGARYRTSGMGRHRVYWPHDAPDSEPVLGSDCPSCGAPLPAEPAGAAA